MMPDNSEQVMNRPELPWDDSFGDHIRILDNVIDHAICDDCIDIFDDLESRGLCHTRRETGKHYGQMSDTSLYWTEMDAMIHRPMQVYYFYHMQLNHLRSANCDTPHLV